MMSSIRLQAFNSPVTQYPAGNRPSTSLRFVHHFPDIRRPLRRFGSLSVRSEHDSAPPVSPFSSEPSTSEHYYSSVGSSTLPLPSFVLTDRHILFLNFIACAVGLSGTWLFVSAIPALLAFKRAAESLEKLLDVTREELPSTMAAIRLSGMELSDLTMELSDLGQELTQGVKRSTSTVRFAEEKLRGLSQMTPSGYPCDFSAVSVQKIDASLSSEPLVAQNARCVKEGIVKGRRMFQMFLTIIRYSGSILNYFSRKRKQ